MILTTMFKKPFTTNHLVETSEIIYDLNINSLQGNPIALIDFKGKHLLVVNVASKCGFTSQYKQLQRLHEQYKDSLVIIGVPCNQFGRQEPGDAFEIQEYCQVNYGVSFLITEKIMVSGKNQHPLYAWLTNKKLNGYKNSTVRWNFQKYLINPEGNIINYFYSNTSPLSKKITKYLS